MAKFDVLIHAQTDITGRVTIEAKDETSAKTEAFHMTENSPREISWEISDPPYPNLETIRVIEAEEVETFDPDLTTAEGRATAVQIAEHERMHKEIHDRISKQNISPDNWREFLKHWNIIADAVCNNILEKEPKTEG